MKRFCCGILIVLMVLCLFACTKDKAEDNTENLDTTTTEVPTPETTEAAVDIADSRKEFYREHQELTALTGEFNPDEMFRVDLHEVGLENVYIKQVESVKLAEDTYGKVYLLADDRYGGGMSTSDHYLLVTVSQKETVNDKMYIKDLTPEYNSSYSAAMSAYLYFADLDGDGDKEIILQECKGMSGGAGSWLSRVFDFNDGIEEMFTSYDPDNKYFETGFSCTLLKDNIMRIDNSFTGYTLEFEVKRENEEYFTYWWYDEEGNPKDHELWIDSFNEFEPQDVDGDGVSEIVCRQYTCLNGHADYVGSAISVLKYNSDTKEFYVADASFEPDQRDVD